MALADPLEWLLPQAPGVERDRARRVTLFLKLLLDAARGPRAEHVGSNVGSVHDELERLSRERIASASFELLCHELQEARPSTSYLPLPCPRGSFLRAHQELEAELNHAEKELCWSIEDTLAPARRAERVQALLRLFEGHGGDPAEVSFLRLAWRHVFEGASAVERSWRALAADRSPTQSSTRALAALGLAAALLERGRARLAWRRLRTWFDAEGQARSSEQVGAARFVTVCERQLEPSAATLLLWAGFAAGAHAWPSTQSTVGLPPSLAQTLCQSGISARSRPVPPAESEAPDLHRFAESSGALVAAAFAWSGSAMQPIAWRVAPRWRAGFGAFALQLASEPDPARAGLWPVLRGSSEWTLRDDPSSRAPSEETGHTSGVPRGALCSTTVVLIREPLRDAHGTVCGWLQLEYDQPLTPTIPACERQAAVLSLAASGAAHGLQVRRGTRRRAALALVRSLPREVLAARWEVHDVDERCPVAHGGGDLGTYERGEGRVQATVVREGACEVWKDGSRQGCHAGAGAGAVFPLRYAGRTHGTLVLERARGRDTRVLPASTAEEASQGCITNACPRGAPLRDALIERVAECVDEHSAHWRAAQFERWHRSAFGRVVALRLDPHGWRRALAAFAVRARHRRTLAVVGPLGSARIVHARWLHFEGPGTDAPCVSLRASTRSRSRAARALRRCWSLVQREGGTLVLDASLVDSTQLATLCAERAASERGLLVLIAERASTPERLGLSEQAILRLPPLHERPEEAMDWAERWLGAERWTPAAGAWIRRQRFPRQLETLAATLREARRRAPAEPLSAKLLDACLQEVLAGEG